MRAATTALLLASALPACTEEDHCDEYVDYMCQCHPDDPETSCEDLRLQYEDAPSSLQEECAISLEDQEEADAESGHECGAAEDTGG